MKTISLTRGQVTLVDDEDYEELSKHVWHACKQRNGLYYAARNVPLLNGRQRRLYMARAIMGAVAGEEVDHRCGVGVGTLNNQRSNLRKTTPSGNRRAYQRKSVRNTSQYRGVSWDKAHQFWEACIQDSRKKVRVGYFTAEKEAAYARDAKARELGWPEEGMNFPRGAV